MLDMREVPFEEYLEFIKKHDHVIIENQRIEIGKPIQIKRFQPQNFKLETTTVWSFPERGKWATHYTNAKYRGNWAPQVPRNLILQYTKPGDVVLDAFLGSGTTLIECKLLGRHGIGVDINYEALMVAWDRLNFKYDPRMENQSTLSSYLGIKEEIEWVKPEIRLYHGDARNLDKIKDESIELIATHPPYANIIGYTKRARSLVEGDLSNVKSIDEFVSEMKKVAEEFYRVLKPGKYTAILMGDTRRHRHYVPIAFRVMKVFLEVGFILKEDIIKIQHHMRGTEPWKARKRDFYLIAHEHLFVFRKPSKKEKIAKFRDSIKI
ncbi:site-specific DNA-methyltransferase [Thermococcus sp. MAR1]|uniref:DNA methyltransferase n=1 Tax=Thermococcus sp. MAR1 TaxID=1638263 RepID=UPI00197F5AB7|nr:site-specific DNA-methyltransferase [Thermococcus sp. MAR1]